MELHKWLGLFFLTFGYSSALILPQCDGPLGKKAIELRENVTGQTVTCDGTGQTGTVQWRYTTTTGRVKLLVTCSSPSSCTVDFSDRFATGTRNSTSSTLTFVGRALRAGHGTWAIGCLLGSDNETVCQLDVIYPSNVSTPSCSITNDWKIRCSCDVTKAFSTRDRYSCRWFQKVGGQVSAIPAASSTVSSIATVDTDYKQFNCSFSIDLPAATGAYSYDTNVHPGDVTRTAGNTINIVTPSSPNPGCPSGYVRDGFPLSCTCTLSTPGTPAARLVWSHDSASGASFTKTVTSQDNGDSFTCQAQWGDRVIRQASYTLHVAYGPSNVAVTGPSSPFDTNGSQTLTLTCQPTTSNPSVPSYSWRRLPDGTSLPDTTSSISVVAATNLNGKRFECRASNSEFNQISATGTYTVNLNYPPVASPAIHNYNNGSVAYAGDVLTMACTVTGGKPVASTKVNFACPGKPDNSSDVTTNTDVSSSLTFNPLQAANHGLTCTCTAMWKNYNDWYAHQATRTLIVYSPPSDPRILVPSTGYPFIAGSTASANITCVSDTPGYPSASYTWTRTAGGLAGAGGDLTFHTVTSDLHNRTVSCRASNAFTVDKDRPLVEASRRLQVYYHPVISVSAGNSSNRCTLTPDRTRCDVTEGDDVNIRCNSHSNPNPSSTRWYKGNPGTSQVGPDSVLHVTSASHVTDNGVYSCQSITGQLPYSHPPLTSTYNLTVLVKYAASQLSVASNNYTKNLTVSEGDHVEVTCAARGRPTPTLQLYNDSEGGTLLDSAVGGKMVVEDIGSSLKYVIDSAMCRHTTTYRCIARNDLNNGDGIENHVELSVLCRPRLPRPVPPEPPSVNYVGHPVQLSLELEAFPLPDNFDFRFLGPGRNLSQPVPRNTLMNISCWNSFASYAVTCNVTVNNVDPTDVGYYSVQIANDVGHHIIEFEISYKEIVTISKPNNGKTSSDAAVIGGVAVAVLAVGVVLVIVTVFVVKRRKGYGKEQQRLQPTGGEWNNTDDSDQDVMIDNDAYGGSGGVAAQTERPGTTARSDYEDVEVAKAKPDIKPKPTLGATPSSQDKTNIDSVANKGRKPSDTPDTGVDSLYASVDKSKKTSFPSRPAPAGATAKKSASPPPLPTSQSGPAAKSKPKKESNPPKQKRGKGREMKKDKKDEKETLHLENLTSEVAVYSNSPLSMNPVESKVYENYAFQVDETEYTTKENKANSSAADGAHTVNYDGLVYSTIAFTESQQKKSQQPPPDRETTEYVGIDFTRHAPPAEG